MSGLGANRYFERRSLLIRFRPGQKPKSRAALLGWYAGVSARVPSKLPIFDDVVDLNGNDIRLVYLSVDSASAVIRRIIRGVSFPSVNISSIKYVCRKQLSTSLSCDNRMVVTYESSGAKVHEEKELINGTMPRREERRNYRSPGDDNRFASLNDDVHSEVDEFNHTPFPSPTKSEVDSREAEEAAAQAASAAKAAEEEKKKAVAAQAATAAAEKTAEEEKKRAAAAQAAAVAKLPEATTAEMNSAEKSKDLLNAAAISLFTEKKDSLLQELNDITTGKVKPPKLSKAAAASIKRAEICRIGRWIVYLTKLEMEIEVKEAELYLHSKEEPIY